MTIYVWPIDPNAGAPVYAARAVRETQSVFLAGATSARPLGAHSGVRPGTSPTTVTATTTTWTVGSHAGVIDLETAADAGPYNYSVNAVGGLPSGAIVAADMTRPRVDIVYARIDDNAEGDASGAARVVFGYLDGVPLAVTPVPPAAPNSRCMIIAWINVPLSGGGAPTVTWKAPYTTAAGAAIPVWSAAERDAAYPILYDGASVYRLDLHCVETYSTSHNDWFGGIWKSWLPIISSSGVAPTLGTTGSPGGYFTRNGKHISGYGYYAFAGTGMTMGTGFWVTSLPTNQNLHGIALPRVGTFSYSKQSTGAEVNGILEMVNAVTPKFAYSNGIGTAHAELPYIAPANGDVLYFNFDYEEA